jgi:DNA-binding CsgD family transcriptional regulator
MGVDEGRLVLPMSNIARYDNLKNVPRRSYDPARLLRELESQFKLSRDPVERARLADWIVPEYVTSGEPEIAARILSDVPATADPETAARLASLHAEVRAMQGEDPEPQVNAALKLVPQIAEAAAALVRHRVGLAYFFARQTQKAEEHSLCALWLSDTAGLRRLAAHTASVLYGVHYYLTGDLEAASYYAELTTVEAASAGHDKLRRQFLIAQFDLAVMFADWDRARSMHELLRREKWYDAYVATAAVREGTALLHAHAGDFAGMRGATDSILESAIHSADYALGRALAAAALAGLGSDEDALREARRALSLSQASTNSELAYLTIRRRLAAIVAAYICILLGDVHRGSRALQSRMKWPGAIGALARALADLGRIGTIDVGDPNLHSVKGYAELANTVKAARLRRLERTPDPVRMLTQTELVLLRSTASGKTNGEIARERGVTRNAVERRLMSAYDKLGVRSRTEALAKLAKI